MGWGARGRAARGEGGPQNRGGWDCDPELGGDGLEATAAQAGKRWCRAMALTQRALGGLSGSSSVTGRAAQWSEFRKERVRNCRGGGDQSQWGDKNRFEGRVYTLTGVVWKGGVESRMQERDTNLWVVSWRLGRASVRGGLIFTHRHRTEDLEEVRGFGGGTDLKQGAGIMYSSGQTVTQFKHLGW